MIEFRQPEKGSLKISFDGKWDSRDALEKTSQVFSRIEQAGDVRSITFDSSRIGSWNSVLVAFLINLNEYCSEHNITCDAGGLPSGVKGLLGLAYSVPERSGARKVSEDASLLEKTGRACLNFYKSSQEIFAFIGEIVVAFARLAKGKSRIPWQDMLVMLQDCGSRAIGIVSLISLLVGFILAFLGSLQLAMFGAQIFIANLVGIGILRQMAAIMTATIMAGRTGASFAAQIGTMQTNEEIDALTTFGISPMDFLVLPRIIALAVMMPLLCLYADLMGIAGGFLVGTLVLGIDFMEYLNQTIAAVRINDLLVGLFMSAVFGILIGAIGCLRGLQCKRSASAVGEVTTSAVVSSIVAIQIATAVITIITAILGI
jgi:phospholipid/cholesterol/gamma-HCH transport system permease protein